MKTRIVKLEKGVFAIEYQKWSPWASKAPWITVNKTFRTRPRAEEYIRKHFSK